MKRVSKLENVEFTPNKLFIKEEEQPTSRPGFQVESTLYTDIYFVTEDRTPEITLLSKDTGIITDQQRDEIIQMYEDTSRTYTLEYSDGSTDIVRFRWETPPTFTETHEGSCFFRAIIPLSKTI